MWKNHTGEEVSFPINGKSLATCCQVPQYLLDDAVNSGCGSKVTIGASNLTLKDKN